MKSTLTPVFFAVLIFLGCNSFAQSRKLLGFVHNALTGKPMKDVNIVILGTTKGTFTNYLGAFELTLEDSAPVALIASHIGFKTVELTPTAGKIRFSMEKDYTQIGDIKLGTFPLVDKPETDSNAPKDFVIIEQAARYPGGIDKFRAHAGNILKRELGNIENNVIVEFTIGTSGKVIDVNVVQNGTKKISGAVGKVFEETNDWIPATQRGNNVPQTFVVLVSDKID